MNLLAKLKDLAGAILRGDVGPAAGRVDKARPPVSSGQDEGDGAAAAAAAADPPASGGDDAEEAAAAWTVMNDSDK